MRLEKHTEEEIEAARSESGWALPNEEQIKEWTKVHDKLSQDLAERDLQRQLQVINLDHVIWPYLSRMGQMVARGKGTSTVLELLHNEKSGAYFPWAKSGILGYDYIDEAVFEGSGIELTRHCVFCRYMCKVIEIDKGDTEKLEYYVRRFAAVFNKLADSCKIQYGILAPFMALPLADIAAENAGMQALRAAQEAGVQLSSEKLQEIEDIKVKVREESKTRRILLMVYPYSHLETEELNEWMGNPVFVEEGGLGTDDWENLPPACEGC
jgi:hypothetical protein